MSVSELKRKVDNVSPLPNNTDRSSSYKYLDSSGEELQHRGIHIRYRMTAMPTNLPKSALLALIVAVERGYALIWWLVEGCSRFAMDMQGKQVPSLKIWSLNLPVRA
jgi:hypothetical protein